MKSRIDSLFHLRKGRMFQIYTGTLFVIWEEERYALRADRGGGRVFPIPLHEFRWCSPVSEVGMTFAGPAYLRSLTV
jgi:hypothetical protein